MVSSAPPQLDPFSPPPVPLAADPPQSPPDPTRRSWRTIVASWTQMHGSWSVSAVAAVVVVIIGLCAFFAGMQFSSLQVAQLGSQLQRVQKVADAGRAPLPTPASIRPPQSSPSAPGATPVPPDSRAEEALREEIRRLQAENSRYHSLLDRQDAEHTAGRSLLAALGVAHSTLLPMKAANQASPVVAYLLVAPGSRFVFVASALPPPGDDHQYQLWFFRNEDPSPLRGPVFDLKQPVAIDLNQVLPAGIISIEVTIEHSGGSDTPSSAPIASCSLE